MRRLLAALVLSGCALTSKATPIDIRYFSPETTTRTTAGHRGQASVPLRLGRVTSSANLRSRIVHRDSTYELGAYETLRWTENPEMFVRRAIARTFFDDRAFAQVESEDVPALDVELVAFEEVRTHKKRSGRVELRWSLHDERLTLASGTITTERDAAGDGIEWTVAAIAGAMEDATAQLASAVATRLAR